MFNADWRMTLLCQTKISFLLTNCLSQQWWSLNRDGLHVNTTRQHVHVDLVIVQKSLFLRNVIGSKLVNRSCNSGEFVVP